MNAEANTRTRLLDLAQDMVQRRGYSSFSFRDLAAAAGITSASVHYHFATKADLAVELVRTYTDRFTQNLRQMDVDIASPAKRLREFLVMFQQSLSDFNKMCLCGVIGSEYGALPDNVKEQVRLYFLSVERWLVRTLDEGRFDGSLHLKGTSQEIASTLMCAAQGASLTARPTGDHQRVVLVTNFFINLVT